MMNCWDDGCFIDASPKEADYPFNPKADSGYVEGWVAFNTAWNSSIAYSAGEMIAITVPAACTLW